MTISNSLRLLVLCIAGWLCACSNGVEQPDKKPTGVSSEEAIRLIRERLYTTDGEVDAQPIDARNGEYYLIVDDESVPRDLFTLLTGIEAPAKEQYVYGYRSSDGKCRVTISGRRVPLDEKYATISLFVPDCPEIRTLHFGTLVFAPKNK